MIKINLLGNETARDNTGIFLMAGYGVTLGLCLLICLILQHSINSGIEELTAKERQLQAELERLQKITVEVKDLEKKEKDYQDKLVVIARLKKSKAGPVRVLDDLNKAVPERAWITGMKEQTGLLRIEGRALDNQTIAGFMKDLDASDYFDQVELVETRQVEDKGVKIKEFVLNTTVSYTGLGPIKPSEPEPAEGGGKPPLPPAPDKEASLMSQRAVKSVS